MKLSKIYYWILPALAIFSITSCRKDNTMGFTPGTGAPTISSVSKLYRAVNDTAITITQTYDASGNVTMKVDTNKTHQTFLAIDSTTVTGNKQNYYVIHGSSLGSTTSITFNGVVSYFNRALISDNTLLVSIPLAVPTTGAAATNKLVVTTLHGSATFSFTTLSPPPTISTVSDYDFWTGSQITITGVGFAAVTSVGLTGSSATATIVNATDSQITLQFPAATVTEANLVFSYSSGGKTATSTTKEVFNDLDNAYVIFGKNSFQNAWSDNSWTGPSGVSTSASHSGSASAQASYPAGGWKVEGWANYYPSLPYDASYKFLSFWVKGGTADHKLVLVGDKMVGGYGQVQNANAYAAQLVDVPPGVWTFVKIPLTPPSTPFSKSSTLLNFWATGTPSQQLGFFLQGMSGDVDETMFFDEVAFIK